MLLPHSNGGCWRSCDKRAGCSNSATTIGCKNDNAESKLQSASSERICLSLSFKATVVESLFMEARIAIFPPPRTWSSGTSSS